MIKNFKEIDIPMTIEELNKGNNDRVITRGNIADFLVKNNYAKNLNDAFSRYLNSNTKTFVKKGGIKADECIGRIKQCGAISILAHPNLYKIYNNFEKHLKNLISFGLDGIECYHSTYSKETENYLLSMTKKYNLLVTGGSDYHGSNKENVFLGFGKNNINISHEDIALFLNKIAKKAKK